MKRCGTLLSIIMGVLIISSGLAVPVFNVSVQGLGEGHATVSSPVNNGRMEVTYFRSGYWYVDKVRVSLDTDLGEATVYVVLKTTRGETYVKNKTYQSVPAGTLLTFDFSGDRIRKSFLNVSASRVIVVSGRGNAVSGRVNVSPEDIGVGIPREGVGCVLVNITERSGETLYNYSVRVEFGRRDIDWDNANESNVYFSTLDGKPLPFWIERWSDGNEADVWVKVPRIEANGNVLLCLNYGVWPNPYESYKSLRKTFLFLDTFDALNTSLWSVHGAPTADGNLTLKAGDWVLLGRNFGDHYAVYLASYLGKDNGTVYTSSSNYNYSLGPFVIASFNGTHLMGLGMGRRYRNNRPRGNVAGYLEFPSQSPDEGKWLNVRVKSRLKFERLWFLFITYVNGELAVYRKRADAWDDPENGDWPRYYNYRNGYRLLASTSKLNGDGFFGLGQWSGGPSYYGWVIVRNYVDKEPEADVLGRTSDVYFLDFKP